MWTKNLFVLINILFIVQLVNSSPKWGSSGRSSSRSSHSYSRPRVSHTSHTSYKSSWSAPKVTHTSHSYPSGRGLSGTSNNQATSVHSYPTGSGLSSSGSSRTSLQNSHSYPSSGGLSGKNNHNYPATGGLSGTGSSGGWINNLPKTNNQPPPYGGNPVISHTYPSSNGGLSGNTNSGSYPHNIATNWNSGTQWNQGSHANPPPPHYTGSANGQNVFTPNHNRPVYHPLPTHYPQYHGPPPVYVTDVRNSGSRYSDLLTGLALYNLGRSSSHHHDNNYYHNNYESGHYNHYNNPSVYNSGSSYQQNQRHTYAKPKNDTRCSLKIVTRNTTETLKVPCDIVTSFFSENKTLFNSTVTKSTTFVTNSSTLLSNSSAIAQNPPLTPNTSSSHNFNVSKLNSTSVDLGANAIHPILPSLNNSTLATNVSTTSANTTKTSDSATTISSPMGVVKDDFNLTIITTNDTNANSSSIPSAPVDPLRMTGPALDINGMACSVEIKTKISTRSTIVPCHLLLQYANSLNNPTTVKPRLDTKEWDKSPPWWSMFAFAF